MSIVYLFISHKGIEGWVKSPQLTVGYLEEEA